jgi:hypothetical protein
MTIINDLEIDNIHYISNDIHNGIKNNKILDNKLNVIIVISNPCQYARRYLLAKEFIQRFEKDEPNVNLYIVELAYKLPGQKLQDFHITDANNKNHLQLTSNDPPLWHKESMIRVGIEKLLPIDWTNIAWIDADIEFDNVHWVEDTLKILNGTRDIVQLFSHILDMDTQLDPMQIFSGFGYQYTHKRKYKSRGGIHYYHPGMAWACTRKAYDQMGGIFDKSILGSGDHNMALAFIGKGVASVNGLVTDDYKNSIVEFQNRADGLTLGYVPGIIRHHFHGAKANRKYCDRWKILVNHKYEPSKHITYDVNGLIIPTPECPKEMLDEIFTYFSERNEDEGFMEAMESMAALTI